MEGFYFGLMTQVGCPTNEQTDKQWISDLQSMHVCTLHVSAISIAAGLNIRSVETKSFTLLTLKSVQILVRYSSELRLG